MELIKWVDQEYRAHKKPYFVWDYHEMLDLARKLFKHRLQIKEEYRVHKKPSRRVDPLVMLQIKVEVA